MQWLVEDRLIGSSSEAYDRMKGESMGGYGSSIDERPFQYISLPERVNCKPRRECLEYGGVWGSLEEVFEYMTQKGKASYLDLRRAIIETSTKE